jgi:ABC-type dipeptide/oligopeptide/nickel transport system permease component
MLCIVISVLASIIAAVTPDYRSMERSEEIVTWGRYLWAYAAVTMGVLLKKKTGKLVELFGGVIAGGLCLIPTFSLFIVLLYSFRSFLLLSRTKGNLPF